FERADVDFRNVFVRTLDFETQARGEVFFVADHDIHESGDFLIHFLRALLAADALPKRWSIVEIVGDDDPMLFRSLHSLDDQPRRSITKSGKNSSRMEPTRAHLPKDMFPIEITRFKLTGGAVASVRYPDRA